MLRIPVGGLVVWFMSCLILNDVHPINSCWNKSRATTQVRDPTYGMRSRDHQNYFRIFMRALPKTFEKGLIPALFFLVIKGQKTVKNFKVFRP